MRICRLHILENTFLNRHKRLDSCDLDYMNRHKLDVMYKVINQYLKFQKFFLCNIKGTKR